MYHCILVHAQYAMVRFSDFISFSLNCQPNLYKWMDEELAKALEEDNKDAFLSIIECKLDLFRCKQQELLYAVCSLGSIKCLEALLQGDTSLTVELNQPCTDMGMYPLHCAALALVPSVVELLHYFGAHHNVTYTPLLCSNPSDIYAHYLLEQHANKLPVEMALWAIS